MQLPAPAAIPAKKAPITVMPTDRDIMKIPKARAGEYELTDKETKRLRSQIYSINKHNVAGFKFRTMREGTLLLVWRIK